MVVSWLYLALLLLPHHSPSQPALSNTLSLSLSLKLRTGLEQMEREMLYEASCARSSDFDGLSGYNLLEDVESAHRVHFEKGQSQDLVWPGFRFLGRFKTQSHSLAAACKTTIEEEPKPRARLGRSSRSSLRKLY